MAEKKYRKKRNVLRELLKAGKPTLGTHVHVIWPGIVEVIGYSRAIDYIEFAGEYAPFDLFSLENFGRAIDLFDHMSSMMKIDQQPKGYLASRAIGSGIQNLLFADIRTVEDAKRGRGIGTGGNTQNRGIDGCGHEKGYRLCSQSGIQGICETTRGGGRCLDD